MAKSVVKNKRGKASQYVFETSVYFNFVILNADVKYYLSDLNDYVINLFILLRNRRKDKVYLFSNNNNNLIAAMIEGFCIVPIANSQRSLAFELHLAEKYLLTSRLHRFPKIKNTEDFDFLNKIIKERK